MTGDERERLMLRENLPDSSGQNEYRMGHGQLDITSEQAMRGETPATLHFRDGKVKQIEDQGRRIQKGADMYDRYEHQYADGGLIAGAKKPSLKGVNAKPAPPSTRDAGKTPPPMIGVRADATAPDIRTEVDMLAHNPDNTVALADGGAIPGYATGGLLFGNYIPGGYNQHGSTTQTSDPLWHMECHRDFGKKG
jgi:hypothetical protein